MQSETVGRVECPECKSNGTAVVYLDKINGLKIKEGYTVFNKYMPIDHEFVLLFKCNNCSNLFIVDVTD